MSVRTVLAPRARVVMQEGTECMTKKEIGFKHANGRLRAGRWQAAERGRIAPTIAMPSHVRKTNAVLLRFSKRKAGHGRISSMG
jgi:hypothetical protein